MFKKLLFHEVVGLLAGVALNMIIAIALSYALRLGYFMPYPAMLPERVGGEMNAVLITALLCGWAGGGVGLAFGLSQSQGIKPSARKVYATLTLCVAVLPALILFFTLLPPG